MCFKQGETAKPVKLIDISQQYQTRNGLSVGLFSTSLQNTDYPVAGYIVMEDGEMSVQKWTAAGRWVRGSDEPQRYDLVPVPKPPMYINVYSSPGGVLWSTYPSVKRFDEGIPDGRIARVKFVEGQFDD